MSGIPDPNEDQAMAQRIEKLEGSVGQILDLLKALTGKGKVVQEEEEKEKEEEAEVVILTSKIAQEKEAGSSAGKVSEEEARIMNKMEVLEEKMRSMQGMESHGSFDMQDFCLFSDMEIPPKFKVPDFEKFEGRSDPVIHLTMYARSMAAHHRNEKLMIHCFQHSLAGGALTWFLHLDKNQTKTWRGLAELFVKQYQFVTDIAPDRFELQRMRKAESETFREYAQRWREIASQVHPPLLENEITRLFMKTLENPYFEKLLGCVTNRFADVVSAGEQVEDAIREGKLSGVNAQVDKQKKPMFQKKEADIHLVGASHYPSKHKPHQPNHQPSPLTVPTYPTPTPQKTTISFPKNPPFAQNQVDQPRRERLEIEPIPVLYDQLYDQLMKESLIGPETPRPPPNPLPNWYNANETCKYHMGEAGHSIERCVAFKVRVQKLRNMGLVNFEEKQQQSAKAKVDGDPLFNH